MGITIFNNPQFWEIRYLTDAASFYEAYVKGFAEQDRPRLLRNMARKIEKKFAETANINKS